MPRQPRTVLVLGGIRSGKSSFAATLVADAAAVGYVAIAAGGEQETATGRRTRGTGRARSPRTAPATGLPPGWAAQPLEAPEDLAARIAAAAPDDVLLVDDLGGWLSALLAGAGDESATPGAVAMDVAAAAEALTGAIVTTNARVVLVSPEVGLAPLPAAGAERAFADACGSLNRALAAACDGTVLVVAGQPTWLRATPGRDPANVEVAAPARAARVGVPVVEADGEPADAGPISLGMSLPLPDNPASVAAARRAETLPVPGPGFGPLTAGVAFAAGVQGTAAPVPFRSVRVIAVHGTYTGGLSAGESPQDGAAYLAATRTGESALARLAAEAGATVEIIDAGPAAPAEDGPVATSDEVDRALRRGYATAQRAADRGDDLIVVAASGAGTSGAAAALAAALTGAEVASLIGRVWRTNGAIDDQAWMVRTVTVRDALRAAKGTVSDAPSALAALGGPALAAATGVVLGAASRAVPVLLDGPVGAAAALAARDYAAQIRLWCLLAAITGEPVAAAAADRLGLEPLVDLPISLGEGTGALAVLPILQSALAISAALGSPV